MRLPLRLCERFWEELRIGNNVPYGFVNTPAGIVREIYICRRMKMKKTLFSLIMIVSITVIAAMMGFSLLGCENPEHETGLTKVNISTDLNGLNHMPKITIPNDGTITLYVTREYVSISGSPSYTVPQSTYKWYKNGNLIDGEQKGSLSIKGPASDNEVFITVENGDKIKVQVTDKDKTVEAETTITVQ